MTVQKNYKYPGRKTETITREYTEQTGILRQPQKCTPNNNRAYEYTCQQKRHVKSKSKTLRKIRSVKVYIVVMLLQIA
jgi:hypothetical protein